MAKQTTILDPRLNAFRPGLAASALKGRVDAARFVDGHPALVARGVADLRRRPEATAPLDTQLLFGETVRVFEQKDGWAWVQNATDGYVGFMEAAALGAAPQTAPSHSLKVLRSFLYPEPDLKAPPLDAISFMSPLRVTDARDKFSAINGAGWLYSSHLCPISETDPDFVAAAHMFLGVPYLWGGRSGLGLDCSTLVQLSLARAGIACTRDSGAQSTSLGEPSGWPGVPLERGDIVYFPGHCAIALNETDVIHANAGAMLTAIEPLADVVKRVEAESGGRGVTGVRRIVF